MITVEVVTVRVKVGLFMSRGGRVYLLRTWSRSHRDCTVILPVALLILCYFNAPSVQCLTTYVGGCRSSQGVIRERIPRLTHRPS